MPNEIQNVVEALDFVCPRFEAVKHSACLTRSGQLRVGFHVERKDQARVRTILTYKAVAVELVDSDLWLCRCGVHSK